MKREYLTLLLGILFIVGAVVFTVKQSWLFSIVFLIVGIVYVLRFIKMSKDSGSRY